MHETEESSASRLLNGINHIWSEELNNSQNEKSTKDLDSATSRELAMTGIEVDDAALDEGTPTATERML